MAEVSAKIMERNNLTSDDVDWLVPHQANLRIIDATAKRMGLPDDKVMINIQKYGNATAGTLPLCLWDYESQLKKETTSFCLLLEEDLLGVLFTLNGPTRIKILS